MRALLERLEEGMSGGTAVAVKELPEALQKALKSVGYGRRDIHVSARTDVDLNPYAGDGQKGFAVVVNLATGVYKASEGSWGGANMFTSRSIDTVQERYPLPPDGAAIVGTTGYHGTSASIYVHPSALAPLLPGNADVTEREARILAMMGFTSAYRKELLADNKVTSDEIDALVAKKMLAKNKAGALSLTTAGKNAAGDRRGM